LGVTGGNFCGNEKRFRRACSTASQRLAGGERTHQKFQIVSPRNQHRQVTPGKVLKMIDEGRKNLKKCCQDPLMLAGWEEGVLKKKKSRLARRPRGEKRKAKIGLLTSHGKGVARTRE